MNINSSKSMSSAAIAVIAGLLTSHPALATPPTLYSQPAHQSPVRAEPDDLLLIPGYGLAADDVVVYRALVDTTQPLAAPATVPADSTATEGVANVVSVADAPYSLTVQLPLAMQADQSYALWIRNRDGEWSNGIRINDARPLWVSPAYAYASAQVANLPRYLKVVGRNLQPAPGATTQVRLSGPTTVTLTAANDNNASTAIEHYVAKVDLPASLPAGDYTVQVSRDGVSWVSLAGQTLTVRPDPAARSQFPVGAYGGCVADDALDDTPCIVSAIAAAKAAGGGDVVFGTGVWRMDDGSNLGPTGYGDGILVGVGVSLRGAGASSTTLVRGAGWNVQATNASFTLQGGNTVEGFTFKDERVHQAGDSGVILKLGKIHYRADINNPADPKLTTDVIITRNVFDKPMSAIGDGGLPMQQVFITYNEIGAFHTGIHIGGDANNLREKFHVDDGIIAHNSFEPGSYIDLVNKQQGAIATEFGAGRRMDFSNNIADGTSTQYFYSPTDPKGWRAAHFWSLRNNNEMLLVSQNSASCTGDKTGDGEAFAYDNNHNAAAFGAARTVLAATPDSVTVAGPLKDIQEAKLITSALATYYNEHWIQVAQGPGVGQVRRVTSYTVNASDGSVTFSLSPAWDVVPSPSVSRVTGGRQFWQTYTVDNFVDHRNPPCLKSNANRPEGGVIGLWAQTADSAVEGNRQYDTDGITLQHSYKAEQAYDPVDNYQCVPTTDRQTTCEAATFFQAFIDIRNNIIDGEYDWNSDCSWAGVRGSHGAAPTSSSPPPVAGYGVSIARNTIRQADALHGGAISFALSWHQGPLPGNWKFINNTLIHNNTIRDVSSPSAPIHTAGCDNAGDTWPRIGINLYDALVWRSVLYRNSCTNVDKPLQDRAMGTVRVCPPDVIDSCECTTAGTDVTLAATASPAKIAVGDSTTFAVQITNSGASAATGVLLAVEPVPGIDVSLTDPRCEPFSRTCALGDLAAGASTSVNVTGTATMLGRFATAFSVTHKEADPDPVNSGASVAVAVVDRADVSVVMTGTPDPVYVGDNLSYTLTVTNNGPATATAVTLTDALPAGANFVSAAPSQGTCTGGSTVTCGLVDLPSGANATITIVATATTAGTLTNTASAIATEIDPNEADNGASIATTARTPVSGGLTGEYFDNPDFSAPVLTRIDATVNFKWTGSPATGVGADTYSVRWGGKVKPQYSQTYTFYIESNDGARLWVNGQLLIDDWGPHGTRERSATIGLSAGQLYDIRMEHWDNTGTGIARLRWSSPSRSKQIVPSGRLYH